MDDPIFMGLDLSLRGTGYAVINKRRETITYGLIKPKSTMKGTVRLRFLRDELLKVLPEGRFVCVVEGYSMNSKGRVFNLGEWGGVARLAIYDERRAILLEVPPKSLKMHATSNGNAEKTVMVARAQYLYGYDGHDDNEADALHAAHMAADWWYRPALRGKQLAGLKAVTEVYPPPFAKTPTRKRSRH